jgi:hypothetical protein
MLSSSVLIEATLPLQTSASSLGCQSLLAAVLSALLVFSGPWLADPLASLLVWVEGFLSAAWHSLPRGTCEGMKQSLGLVPKI